MLQTYSEQQPLAYEGSGQGLDVSGLIRILRRRVAYFALPFLLVLTIGAGIVAIQRPIYRAEGKILVQSPEIPPDLVRPTITEVADERIQVIQQRLLARDNLISLVGKYNLFPRERAWMSSTALLDLMRSRIDMKPVALDAQYISRPTNPAIAFTLAFDYEVPDLAMKVANDFLTAILSEDATTRTNNASETTKFLEREVKRLQGEHDAVVARIEAQKQRPPDPEETGSEEFDSKMKLLASLEADLAQKSAVYSAQHPVVKNLQKQIASLKHDLAAARRPARLTTADKAQPQDVALEVLDRQRIALERDLDEASRKLMTARMGESLERAQQGERLQVIEQPSLPTSPVRPKRMKWFAAAFVLAAAVGAGVVILAEMLDATIRGHRELGAVVDSHLIVTIPYIATPGEETRRRVKLGVLCLAAVGILAGAITFAVMKGITIDFLLLDRSWLDPLTRILH